MSIWTSLYTGASGLQAHGDAISVVGDNIANVSTIGFRENRASFQDVIGGTANNGQRLGAGVAMNGVQANFGQGSLQTTGRGLNLAIRGGGFFMVNGNHQGVDSTFFSRDGRFVLDKSGTVVNQEGLRLQGYVIDSTGAVAKSTSDLTVGGNSPPAVTTKVDVGVNLDSTKPVAPAWNPATPGTTSTDATSTTVYDSLGNSHRVDMYFSNQGGGNWTWHAMVDGGELTGGTAGVPTEIANGTATFDATGKLVTQTTAASSANFLNAQPGQVVNFNFGDPTSTGGTGIAGTTQYAEKFSVSKTLADGYGAGQLVDISVADDGTMTGKFSNGQSRAIAQVALASFQDQEGLERMGSQLFHETSSSGQALVGTAGTGARGAMSSGALEGSNVDLSQELVTLIAFQRAFSANAKTVTTADEMLQEVSNLKR